MMIGIGIPISHRRTVRMGSALSAKGPSKYDTPAPGFIPALPGHRNVTARPLTPGPDGVKLYLSQAEESVMRYLATAIVALGLAAFAAPAFADCNPTHTAQTPKPVNTAQLEKPAPQTPAPPTVPNQN